jgi:WhiB family transcriptional regulator, redox-sensing transcriptional regulator
MLNEDWWSTAACRSAEPEIFFPISNVMARADIARAKRICAACPVTRQCLNYALHHRQEQGIWGGLTDDERRLVRRRVAVGNRRESTSAALRR